MKRTLRRVAAGAALLLLFAILAGWVRLTRWNQMLSTSWGESFVDGGPPIDQWSRYAIVTPPVAWGLRGLQRQTARSLRERLSQEAMVHRTLSDGEGAYISEAPQVKLYRDEAAARADGAECIVSVVPEQWISPPWPFWRNYQGQVIIEVQPAVASLPSPQEGKHVRFSLRAQGTMAGIFMPRHLTATVANSMAKSVTDDLAQHSRELFEKAQQEKARPRKPARH